MLLLWPWDEIVKEALGLANAGDSPRRVVTPSPRSGRKIVSWFLPCLAFTCTAFNIPCDLSVVFPHSEAPYPSTTASNSWRDRRYREISVVSLWAPPTQFAPVRKSFRGWKTRRLNRPANAMNAIVCWFGTSCVLSQIPAWDKTKLRTKS